MAAHLNSEALEYMVSDLIFKLGKSNEQLLILAERTAELERRLQSIQANLRLHA